MDTVAQRQASPDFLEGGGEMRFDYDEPERPALAAPPMNVLRLLRTKWSARILLHLAQGPSRYSGIRRSIPGISEKMLQQLLGKLQSHGLIKRTVWPAKAVHIEYALTATGTELVGLLDELGAWAEAAGLGGEGR